MQKNFLNKEHRIHDTVLHKHMSTLLILTAFPMFSELFKDHLPTYDLSFPITLEVRQLLSRWGATSEYKSLPGKPECAFSGL